MKKILNDYNIKKEDLITYPNNVYKIRPNTDFSTNSNSRLILVTAINPTPAGEGKTTIAIELTDALNAVGKKTILCLRQPAIGPTLGLKGGGTGFGRFEIIPSDEINLGLTGDFFVIETINNLIASLIDNQLYFDNELKIDPNRIVWKRVYDMSDRGLREIRVKVREGLYYYTGFDITPASEIMAILCLAKNMDDFIERINNITIAYDTKGRPIYARSLHIENKIRILAKNLLWPNVVQTKNHSLCFLHGGPFANIAHGCNSILALNTASKYARYVVTEAGFGADLGAEKFIDIIGQLYRQPDYVFICTTIKSISYHGDKNHTRARDIFLSGTSTITQNILGLKAMNITPCIILNKFADDDPALIEEFKDWAEKHEYKYLIVDPATDKKQQLEKFGKDVLKLLQNPCHPVPLYKKTSNFKTKIKTIIEKVYGLNSPLMFSAQAEEQLKEINNKPYYLCVAKTPLALSSNPKDVYYSPNQQIEINSFCINSGAEFIIPICGNIYRMPGLPKKPHAQE